MSATMPPRLALPDAPGLMPLRPSLAALGRAAVDAATAIGVLALYAAWYGIGFGNPYLILSLIVFALTFPGNLTLEAASAASMAGRILLGWGLVLALLWLLGWTTGTLYYF